MQNLVEYVHVLKILDYSWKFNTKKCDVLKKLYVFLITHCKRFHPKNPFYEKMKMTTKRIIVLESFVIVGSFDCDHTHDLYFRTPCV
jgi:hypothetical protein